MWELNLKFFSRYFFVTYSLKYKVMEGHNLKTLSEVFNVLISRGITKEIRMNDDNQMVLGEDEKTYSPEQLCIVKSYRFEGDSSSDDNSVLYLIEDQDGELATLLDSYGAESNYSGDEFADFLRAIPVRERTEFDFG